MPPSISRLASRNFRLEPGLVRRRRDAYPREEGKPALPLKQHLLHSRRVTVDDELVHVDAWSRLTGVVGVFAVPAGDVLAAWESKVGDGARVRGRLLVGRGAIDEDGSAYYLRQDVVDPEGHDMTLRTDRTLGVADAEGNRRLA